MEYEVKAKLVALEGVSKKTNKPYRLVKLVVDTELFGNVEIMLDTHHDRSGIVLDMLARACERKE